MPRDDVTMEEVSKHNLAEGSVWTVIHNEVATTNYILLYFRQSFATCSTTSYLTSRCTTYRSSTTTTPADKSSVYVPVGTVQA